MTSESRVAVVTGGNSGLGKACVDSFVSLGIRVIAVDLKVDAVSPGPSNLLESFAGDVSSEKDIEALAEHVQEKYGRLDILINCAGIGHANLTYDFTTKKPHSLELFNRVLRVNTVGTFNVIRLLVPIMSKTEPDSDGQRGVIINTSSVIGLEGSAGFAAYSASKSAVAGMTLPLAREFGPLGIRVVTIAPGGCETPMVTDLPDSRRIGYMAQLNSWTLFPKRLIRPQEFAHLVQSVIDNHSINAEVIRLDAGARFT